MEIDISDEIIYGCNDGGENIEEYKTGRRRIKIYTDEYGVIDFCLYQNEIEILIDALKIK